LSTTLPAYSFDNIGRSYATLGSAVSAVAADNGRYIQDDLPLTVVLPDGTSLPMSSFATNSLAFASPGMMDGASHSRALPMTAAVGQPDFIVSGSDSLNLGGNVSGTLTSEELTQYLQNGSVLSEMQSDDFTLQLLDGIMFQQPNETAAAGPPPPAE